jgi:hypothetical protein
MHTDLAGATEKLSGRHGGRRQWGARVGLGFEGGDAAEIGGEAEQERREMRRTLAEEGGRARDRASGHPVRQGKVTLASDV